MSRRVLTDRQWAIIEPLASHLWFWASKEIVGALVGTTGFSWMLFFGWRGGRVLGATYRPNWDIGKASIRVSGVGLALVFGRVFSKS